MGNGYRRIVRRGRINYLCRRKEDLFLTYKWHQEIIDTVTGVADLCIAIFFIRIFSRLAGMKEVVKQ